MATTPGLFNFLVQIANEIRQSRRTHLQSLAALADKKFEQLDQTHRLFVGLLDELYAEVGSVTSKSESKLDPRASAKQIMDKCRAIMDARSKGREQRRSDYEEARVYADKAIVDGSFLKKTPDEVRDNLQTLMTLYCEYFSTEREYRHQLELVLHQVSRVIDLYANLRPDGQANMDRKLAFESDLDRILRLIDEATKLSRERWARVAKAYHSLAYSLRQYGLHFQK